MTPTAADRIIQDVCDLDPTDYPDDDPDTLRVSRADLRVIIDRETATLTERLARVTAERDAWRAFAEHQELCSTCGEDFVGHCDDGRTLRDAALGIVADGADQPEANDGD